MHCSLGMTLLPQCSARSFLELLQGLLGAQDCSVLHEALESRTLGPRVEVANLCLRISQGAERARRGELGMECDA